MSPASRVLLLTGEPGAGKTTALHTVAKRLLLATGGKQRSDTTHIAGFLTLEVRSRSDGTGSRTGFKLVDLHHGTNSSSRQAELASITGTSDMPRVGKYFVNVSAIDTSLDHYLPEPTKATLYLIDEIGKMECLSPTFCTRLISVLDSAASPDRNILVVATIAKRGTPFINRLKLRPETELWHLQPNTNRDLMPTQILHWLQEHGIDVPG
eukprot:Clim_evm13s15 gene=Clim_evmTU13s15